MDWIKKLLTPTKVEETYDHLPTIVFIHGANQSQLCWNYIRSQLPNYKTILIDYSSYNKFYNNLDDMINKLKDVGPVFIVGHSLGGIYALHLLEHVNVVGAISISTPFGGSWTADWAKFLVRYQLFRDVGVRSKPIVEAQKIKINVPWTQVISTKGNVPYHNGINDGVVTIDSMRLMQSQMECIELEYNHYEVIVTPEIVDIIKTRYESVF